MVRPTPPVALTIAGTDSGAGAGVGADLKTFAALGVHGTFAVTAVTAQNTTAVRAVAPMATDLVAAQIEAVTDDLNVAATKTGLLWGSDIVASVGDRTERLGRLVVDPVLVNSSRERIQPEEVDDVYRERLFPAALVVTPNVAEAALLSGRAIGSIDDAMVAAEALLDTGADHVVVTGLLDDGSALDAWAGPDGLDVLDAPRVDTRNVHGTGCSFAAAITARLAHGDSAAEAIRSAKRFVAGAIQCAAGWELGAGQGPIDHFWQEPHV